MSRATPCRASSPIWRRCWRCWTPSRPTGWAIRWAGGWRSISLWRDRTWYVRWYWRAPRPDWRRPPNARHGRARTRRWQSASKTTAWLPLSIRGNGCRSSPGRRACRPRRGPSCAPAGWPIAPRGWRAACAAWAPARSRRSGRDWPISPCRYSYLWAKRMRNSRASTGTWPMPFPARAWLLCPPPATRCIWSNRRRGWRPSVNF